MQRSISPAGLPGGWWRGLIALAAVLGVTTGSALAQSQQELEQALEASKLAIKQRAQAEQDAASLEKVACDKSDEADKVLLQASPADKIRFIEVEKDARDQHAKCTSAKAAVALAKQTQALARDQMRDSAARLAACLTDAAKNCPKPLQPPEDDGQKDTKEENPLALLLAKAGKAQGDVDKLRKKAAPAYDNGDEATSSALGIVYRELSGANGFDRAKFAETQAETARTTPRQVREAVGAAQRAADGFVAATLAIRSCVGKTAKDNTCDKEKPDQVRAAQAAQGEFKLHSDRASELLDRLDQARFSLAALAAENDASEEEVKRAVLFRKLLDSNPDVKSYFGSDAVGLSAGTTGNSVSLRYTMENAQALGRRRATVIITSPTSGAGGGALYDTADRFKDKASISLGFQTTRVGKTLPFLNVVQDWALGVTLAREDRSYLLPGSAAAPRLSEQTRSYYNRGVSGSYVWLLNPKEGTRMAKLRLAQQQVLKDQSKVRQCDASQSNYTDPKDPTKTYNLTNLSNCVEGSVGEPGRTTNRVVEFGFKQLGLIGDADVGLTVTHALRDSQTDVELPIYFWKYKNTTPGGDGLTGGLMFNWTSIKPGLKWGLFVSTPLSFARPAER